jgi:hypothetical protein
MSLRRALQFCVHDYQKEQLHALAALCKQTDHKTGMRTQGGCICGSSVGGGLECCALRLLLDTFVLYHLQKKEEVSRKIDTLFDDNTPTYVLVDHLEHIDNGLEASKRELIAFKGLHHKDVEVRNATVALIERWKDLSLRPFLVAAAACEPVKRFREYLEVIISKFENK